jgi:hypothetical protein
VSAHHDALARTTLLLDQEWFSGQADRLKLSDALLGSTVRLVADAQTLSCRAGQTALVSAFTLTARMGLGIELRVPNVPVIDLVAPLHEPRLRDALLELGDDLIPGARVRTTTGEAQETFVFGTAASEHPDPVRVSASDLAARLDRGGEGTPSSGALPLGGFAAGAAVAAIALEATLPRLEAATGRRARTPRPSPGPPVRIDLAQLFPGLRRRPLGDLGDLDVISGGAISHGLIFCLLRVPDLHARLRVIEPQDAELSNVNRYSLLRASHDGDNKLQLLREAATQGVRIHGVNTLFTRQTRAQLQPLAARVLVGVDDIQARWWVQEAEPEWLAIGATGNHIAQLSTHLAGSPCAACVHPMPLGAATIPTISFVSFWAGLLHACALVSGSHDASNIFVYPFALGGPAALARYAPAANPDCRLRCPCSRSAAA